MKRDKSFLDPDGLVPHITHVCQFRSFATVLKKVKYDFGHAVSWSKVKAESDS